MVYLLLCRRLAISATSAKKTLIQQGSYGQTGRQIL